jgi:phosphocarrier protein HPr
MIQRTVTVGSQSGLHARPAAIFVKAASALPIKVTISVEGKKPAVARSMLGVLALGATCGTAVTLAADDDGDGAAQAAVDELADLLARDLDREGDG